MNQNTEKKKFVFTKESLKKKFRISEFLSEKIITSVAFLSIAIIILIFFFVFRETMPIFKSQTAVESQPATAMVQEQYGVDSSLILNDQGQEQYGVDSTVMVNANGQEQYGVTESGLQDTGEVSSTENAAGSEHEVAVLKSLVGKDWLPVSDHPRYGLIPLFVGTLKITLLAILFAAPIAILAALFTAAFAPNWLREIIKPAIELLAGFPSVVIGFFALMVMASFFQGIFGYESRLNAFVGGSAMALAAIPIIYTITEDALTAIPASYKEASLALATLRPSTRPKARRGRASRSRAKDPPSCQPGVACNPRDPLAGTRRDLVLR